MAAPSSASAELLAREPLLGDAPPMAATPAPRLRSAPGNEALLPLSNAKAACGWGWFAVLFLLNPSWAAAAFLGLD